MNVIKVMLVEDDPFWQKRLSSDLAEELDLELVGVASALEEALDIAQLNSPDIALIDINLTDNNLDGLEITKHLTLHYPGIKIIMLTSLQERDIIVRSYQWGAINFISKSSYQDILDAIRDAQSGRVSIHPDSASVLRDEIRLGVLSPTEREIYDLKQQGYNKTQIAKRLVKSVNTVKTQWKRIKEKLHLL